MANQVTKLIEQRRIAREEKNFSESDRLREELRCIGVLVTDTKEGQRVEGQIPRVLSPYEYSLIAKIGDLEYRLAVLQRRESLSSKKIADLITENLTLKYSTNK